LLFVRYFAEFFSFVFQIFQKYFMQFGMISFHVQKIKGEEVRTFENFHPNGKQPAAVLAAAGL